MRVTLSRSILTANILGTPIDGDRIALVRAIFASARTASRSDLWTMVRA